MVDVKDPFLWFGIVSIGLLTPRFFRPVHSAAVSATGSDTLAAPPPLAVPAKPLLNHPSSVVTRGRYVLLALAIAAVFYIALQGWSRDFTVPLSFSGDSLVYQMLVKGTVDHGWWWTNPSLSAPYR